MPHWAQLQPHGEETRESRVTLKMTDSKVLAHFWDTLQLQGGFIALYNAVVSESGYHWDLESFERYRYLDCTPKIPVQDLDGP